MWPGSSRLPHETDAGTQHGDLATAAETGSQGACLPACVCVHASVCVCMCVFFLSVSVNERGRLRNTCSGTFLIVKKRARTQWRRVN